MSSRNQYLTGAERDAAPQLYATLRELAAQLGTPGLAIPVLEQQAAERLKRAGLRPEYVSVRRQENLGIAGTGDRDLVILAAAWLGKTRLIDNLEVRRG
jgi:pantoate--beta-alanine ligase